MNSILVVAPHPDDETLGCGGTLLHHKSRGDEIHWLIATTATEDSGYSPDEILERSGHVRAVADAYGYSSVHHLDFTTTTLDTVPLAQIVQRVGCVIRETRPEVVYVPFPGDIHSDHRVVFDAASSCAKWFRFPSVKRMLAYETLSETDSALNPGNTAFRPNVFVDISRFLAKKIEIMKLYEGELGEFPFPRSERALRSLAALRGVAAGFEAAEAFMLLKEMIQ